MKLFEVLTGFKYIGEKIKEFELSNEYTYEFGIVTDADVQMPDFSDYEKY